ncbi:MAG: dihydroorotase [Gemmatimonadetes bacterium]|nr:dihydroorotase [Gemmatimonadota bacterium]
MFGTTPDAFLLKNGRILDPASGTRMSGDVLVSNGKIVSIKDVIDEPAELTLDVSGKFIVPGLIDVHVHLRDPGFPAKETIETGCEAAAAGGFTSVVCLPNTDPVIDSPAVVQDIQTKAASADARVYVVACGTKGMSGREITDTDALLEAGVVGFSDDGLPIESADIMRELLARSERSGTAVCPHVEDFRYTRDGVMHEGSVSAALGYKGMGAEGEAAMIERDIDLVREVGGKLHILHISVRRGIELVRKAKAEGLSITCEACPHHFILTDEDVPVFGTAGKMSPPLRTADDREAVLEGLADGTIDIIATDHAPHTREEKLRAFPEAPNGILGLETALGSVISALVETGILTLEDAVAKMTNIPADLYGLEGGKLEVGGPADITVIDPSATWQVDATQFKSKSRNTPFHGWTFTGRPDLTVMGGRITHKQNVTT